MATRPSAPRARRRRAPAATSIRALQRKIEALYGARDRARGLPATFMWFCEEVGELSRALRRRDRRNLEAEFADVLAWLSTLASLAQVDLDEAAGRYANGCPRCRARPCACANKPRTYA